MTATEQQLHYSYEALQQEYIHLVAAHEESRQKWQQCKDNRQYLQEELIEMRLELNSMEKSKVGEVCRQKCKGLEADYEALVEDRDKFRDRLCKLVKAMEMNGEAVRKVAEEVTDGVDCTCI